MVSVLSAMPEVREYIVDKQGSSVNEILKSFGEAFRIRDISIEESDIEEIVRNLYESIG